MSVRFLYLLLLLSTSCSQESDVVPHAARRTVLVYLAGDNNLADEVREKIDSLTAGWHNQQDNLLIYQDARDSQGMPSLLRLSVPSATTTGRRWN